MTEMCSLTVLEAGSPSSQSVSSKERVPSCFSSSRGFVCPLACRCITPVSASVFTWLLCVCLTRTHVIGFGVHSCNPGWNHLKSLNLTSWAGTCFPSKFMFTDSRDLYADISFGELTFSGLHVLYNLIPKGWFCYKVSNIITLVSYMRSLRLREVK